MLTLDEKLGLSTNYIASCVHMLMLQPTSSDDIVTLIEFEVGTY